MQGRHHALKTLDAKLGKICRERHVAMMKVCGRLSPLPSGFFIRTPLSPVEPYPSEIL